MKYGSNPNNSISHLDSLTSFRLFTTSFYICNESICKRKTWIFSFQNTHSEIDSKDSYVSSYEFSCFLFPFLYLFGSSTAHIECSNLLFFVVFFFILQQTSNKEVQIVLWLKLVSIKH